MRFTPKRRAARAFLAPSFAVALAALSPLGCYSDYSASPSPAAVAVGPAPLRRLTNEEYLNALHDLYPAVSPTLPVLPDDATVAGFDNAAEAQEPSDVLIARYETIANAYGEALTASDALVRAVTGCADYGTPALASACGRAFIETQGARVFRRPLSSDETARFVTRFQSWQSAVDFAGAVQLTLSAMLQSPQFVYRPEPIPDGAANGAVAPLDPYAMATRLSFFLWKSTPDDALMQAAAAGKLVAVDDIRAEATRMLMDPRARRTLGSFHRQWLGLDRILLDEHTQRTAAVDPKWTTATQQSLNQETALFIENTLAEGGTFRDLFTSRKAWVDGEAARVYRLAPPDDPNAWTEVTLPESERAGLLTRGAFLAGYSHRGATSPPVRGNWVSLRLLCALPLSPPPGVDLSQPMAQPGDGPQTNRMLFEARTKPPVCQGCHAGLNGFGFGLEHYDAAGAYQTKDNGLPVDATGKITGTDVDGPFDGAIALGVALSKSPMVHRCATERWVRYAVGRAPADVEAPVVAQLGTKFIGSGGDVRGLLLDIVTSDTFRLQQVVRESSP